MKISRSHTKPQRYASSDMNAVYEFVQKSKTTKLKTLNICYQGDVVKAKSKVQTIRQFLKANDATGDIKVIRRDDTISIYKEEATDGVTKSDTI